MSGKLTNEEIAKQFQLPERKSKLKTLLKQDKEKYCFCRSSDTTCFMICCDACEEWFHGDCIGISQKEANSIELYYCDACRTDQSLKIVFRRGRKSHDDRMAPQSIPPSHFMKKASPVFDEIPSPVKRGRPAGRPVIKPQVRATPVGVPQNPWKHKSTGKRGRPSKRKVYSGSASDGMSDIESNIRPQVNICLAGSACKDDMQCFGPHCTNEARRDSKYCSDDCGKKLSTNRLLHILPHRVHDWTQTDSVAEMFALEIVKDLKEKELKAKRILLELDEKNKELDEAIARAREIEIDGEKKSGVVDEADLTLYCVTCGHEIHIRTALKHMEKCFSKYEGQSTFGSLYKTKIEGNHMFCDFYNPANRTYCKRLRVLCPEHFKDRKVGRNEICGCPLVKDVFKETGEICYTSKKDCSRHFGWEKLRQAEIDMERVRQWLVIDETAEKLRVAMNRVSGRVGALPLLLNSTYDHDLKEKMTPEQDQQLLKSLEDSLVSRYGRDRMEKFRMSRAHKDLLQTISQKWLTNREGD